MAYQYHHLPRLERVVCEDLPDFYINDHPYSPVWNSELKDLLKDEADAFIAHLHYTFSQKSNKTKRKYVGFYQRKLIFLIDSLLTVKPPEVILTPSKGSNHLCHIVYKHIEGLLKYLEHYCFNHLDALMALPSRVYILVLSDMHNRWLQIDNTLRKSKVSPQLISILNEVILKSYQASKEGFITFHQWRYLRKLTNELSQIEVENSDDLIEKILFYLNFNDEAFYVYLVNKVELLVEGSPFNTTGQKLVHLWKLKLTAIPVQNKWVLYPGYFNLRDQFTAWLKYKLKSLKGNYVHTLANSTSQFIRFSLSVAQLALLLRLFMEAQIINGQSVRSVIKLVTQVCATREADVLSFRSFYNKYYLNEEGTRQAVKSILLNLLEHLDRL